MLGAFFFSGEAANSEQGYSRVAHLSDHYCCIYLRHVDLDFGRLIDSRSEGEHKPVKVGLYKPAVGDPAQLTLRAVTVQL